MASPATAKLASTLLGFELEDQKVRAEARAFTIGIKSIDQQLSLRLWTGGKLIGVVSGGGSSLNEEIISAHLLSCREGIIRDADSGSGFIIAPHSSSIISSIHDRLVDRLSHMSYTQEQSNAVKYLENVQLLQFFDFAGITESVAEVSSLLFHGSHSSGVKKTILYLEGVGIAIENVQRRSGMVQANAMLSSLLRTLVHLSRTYPCLLILLQWELRKDSKRDEAIRSAFTSATASEIKHQPGGALGRTLEGGLDVMVVVHDGYGITTDGSMIVEVVKDRAGNSLHQWAVWKTR